MNVAGVAAPLLATKLYVPAPRATAVTRSRLVERLRTGMRSRLTLLAAPAGFGKSTLLAQALTSVEQTIALSSARSARCSAWVTIDPGDNDRARFWSYICTALERACPGVGAPAMAMLRAAPSAIDPTLAELLNALAAHDGHIMLILDDYHVITNLTIHEGVSFLLDHAPPQFHMVIASRIDPPLPLARWRARGELVELRAADLRFTTDEAVQFFSETMGLGLDAEAVAALEARTEGWAAGLQLAALSLEGQPDARRFIETFSGSHRHVIDYLAEEVLNRQPEHIREFLIQTSLLERMCGPLCDAVLGLTAEDEQRAANNQRDLPAVRHPAPVVGDSYSQLILTEIERANLFLIPLDAERRWYRYHHLFADLLRYRLRQEQPAHVAEVHRRAARWFEQHGTVAEAMNHALAADDTGMAARLLAVHGARFTTTGEMKNLQRWFDALPREQVLRDPHLSVTQAQVLMLERQTAAAEPYLQAAEAALAGDAGPDALRLQGELLTLRAHSALERGNFGETLALAQQAMDVLPPHAYLARSTNGLTLGYALMVLGQTTEAIAVYSENVRLCRRAGNIIHGIFSANEIVKLRVLQGRLQAARASVEHALAWIAEEGWEHMPPASALHIWRGHILLEQGDVAAAEAAFAHAVQLSQHGVAITMARAHVFLARLRQIQGNSDGANAALAVVEEICRDWERGGERAFFEAYTARVRLLQGDVEAARCWASAQAPWSPDEPPSYFREIELLTLARMAVLDESHANDDTRLHETCAMLAWLRDHATAAGRGAVIIETLALEALAHARRGAEAQAHEKLDQALTQAAPEGWFGLFLAMGAPMAALLERSLTRRAASDPLRPYLAQLLRMFAPEALEHVALVAAEYATRTASAPQDVEALTEREREVLRLFAAGMTGPEIAQHCVVSINTVKTQLKSIYSKLGAHSRAEAVARARELGIIP